MQLYSVLTARQFDENSLMLQIDATINGVRDVYPFLYDPRDTEGLAPDITAWVMSHPQLIIDPTPPPVRPEQVWAEKDRRWALGFDYAFGDARGVHHIGTSPKDLADWQKVSQLAQALLNAGQSDFEIQIYTDTGPTSVTPVEWQAIIIATGQFFQPLLDRAAALVATNPIPGDFADDKYWAP